MRDVYSIEVCTKRAVKGSQHNRLDISGHLYIPFAWSLPTSESDTNTYIPHP